MRRTISLLFSGGLAVMMFSGAALAATITGTSGHDSDDLGGQNIYGTADDDTIYALAGHDYVNALEGSDVVYGDSGNDQVSGESGNKKTVR